jgi:mRNA-degrading endonuclease HigB of HigAB toxin-antitoxin module
VSGDRVVFNIKRNSYRLVAAVDYDQIDVTEVEYGD